ncbi:MAG: hypothetical protein ABI164_04395 [Acidobacteriaceae bacterium]
MTGGRPSHTTRSEVNGVFWVRGDGGAIARVAAKTPPFQTRHRRLQPWLPSGKPEEALHLRTRHLHERGKLNLGEAFADSTFASEKKGPS